MSKQSQNRNEDQKQNQNAVQQEKSQHKTVQKPADQNPQAAQQNQQPGRGGKNQLGQRDEDSARRNEPSEKSGQNIQQGGARNDRGENNG